MTCSPLVWKCRSIAGKFVAWLSRGSLGLWLFLAFVVTTNLMADIYHLSKNSSITQNWLQTSYLHESAETNAIKRKAQEWQERYRRKELMDLVVHSILIPTFLGLAYWRWKRDKSGRRQHQGSAGPDC
jgi:hypothetical protein